MIQPRNLSRIIPDGGGIVPIILVKGFNSTSLRFAPEVQSIQNLRRNRGLGVPRSSSRIATLFIDLSIEYPPPTKDTCSSPRSDTNVLFVMGDASTRNTGTSAPKNLVTLSGTASVAGMSVNHSSTGTPKRAPEAAHSGNRRGMNEPGSDPMLSRRIHRESTKGEVAERRSSVLPRAAGVAPSNTAGSRCVKAMASSRATGGAPEDGRCVQAWLRLTVKKTKREMAAVYMYHGTVHGAEDVVGTIATTTREWIGQCRARCQRQRENKKSTKLSAKISCTIKSYNEGIVQSGFWVTYDQGTIALMDKNEWWEI